MARDTMTSPRQFPSSDSELAVASESNLQVTLTGEELVRTFTVPLPLQFPSSELRKAASSAYAAEAANSVEAAMIAGLR